MINRLITPIVLGSLVASGSLRVASGQVETDVIAMKQRLSPYIEYGQELDRRVEYAKELEVHANVRAEMRVQRTYEKGGISPIRRTPNLNLHGAEALYPWFQNIRKILTEVGLIEPILQSSHSGPIGIGKTVDLLRYETHARQEREGNDGQEFTNVRVLIAVCHSDDFEDIDRVYYLIRRLLDRQAMFERGPLERMPVRVGDDCYHFSERAFGFCRGNVIVEIGPSRYTRRDGKLTGLEIDDATRRKMIAAAQRIDAMLMEKMFTPEVRKRIRAAEKRRDAELMDEHEKQK